MSDFRKLDRNKDYGTVHGTDVLHSFEQNGFPYDFQGILMEEAMTPDMRTRMRRLVAEEESRKAAEKARVAALKKAGFEPGDVPPAAAPGPAAPTPAASAADGDDVDLVGWYRGTAQYRFDQVQAAVMAQFATHVNDEANARKVIADEKGL